MSFPTAAADESTVAVANKPSNRSAAAHAVPRPATSTRTPRSTGSPAWPTPRHYPTRKRSRDRLHQQGQGVLHRYGIRHVHRILTDNGACYRAKDFATVLREARHQRITPYAPRHNGKVERYHRILAEEFLYAYAWTSGQHRSAALQVWNLHYNYHRPHTAAGDQPPATRLPTSVTNVMTSYN